jgi:hypothetical protein
MNREGPRIRANGLGDIVGGRFGIILIALVGLFLYWQTNQKEVLHADPAERAAAGQCGAVRGYGHLHR